MIMGIFVTAAFPPLSQQPQKHHEILQVYELQWSHCVNASARSVVLVALEDGYLTLNIIISPTGRQGAF